MAELTDEQKDSDSQPLEAVFNAAKVAAASAAVGAAAAAAKALASRHDEDQEQAAAEPEPERQPEEGDEEEAQAEQPYEAEQYDQEEPEEEEEEPVEGAPLGDARSAAQHAREQLEELLGKSVESVSSLERTHDGWVVALEVVELQRVPESTDVLASYELELDGDLNFRRYQQARRYHRAQADRGDEA
jgi:hypothetical protein